MDEGPAEGEGARRWERFEDQQPERPDRPRPVMEIGEAARLLGVSQDWVRRWIDAHEPDAEHPDRVPVAARARTASGPVKGAWRRPYRDAVEDEARRRSGKWQGRAAPPDPAGS